jgi:hypothetical protein
MNTRLNFKKTNKIGKITVFHFYPPNSYNYSIETPPNKNDPYGIGIAFMDMKKRQLVPSKPLEEEEDKEVKRIPLKTKWTWPQEIIKCYTDDAIKDILEQSVIMVDKPKE